MASATDHNRPDRNKEVVTRYLEVFRTWDPAQYEVFLTEEPVYRVGQTEHRGRAGFAQVARYGAELYPNGTNPEIEAMIAEGDAVAVRLVMRAVTNKGEDYENTYLLWFDLEDGKIARQWEILDFRYAGEKFDPPSSG
jgi:ketosteroid isomerase-like protein